MDSTAEAVEERASAAESEARGDRAADEEDRRDQLRMFKTNLDQ